MSWSAGLRILKQVPDGSPDLDSTNCQPDFKYLFLTWLTRLPPKFSSLSLSACATVSFVDAKMFHLRLFQLALFLLLLPGIRRIGKEVGKNKADIKT